MTTFDAWCVARLRADRLVAHADRGLVSAPLRPLVNHLVDLDAGRRDASWAGFLAGQSDPDAIRRAVADADPDGPRPEPGEADEEADEHDGWGPARLAPSHDVEPFPLDVLPLAARLLAEEAASSVGCPVDFPAVAALAVAGGIIGRSASLRLKEGYFAMSSLWIAVVGTASDGKSPAIDCLFEPARRIDAALHAEHEQKLEQWQDERSAKKTLKEGPAAGEPEKSRWRKPPPLGRIDVDDVTTESLVAILAENRRGLLQHKDELSSFLLGMDQYRSGGKGSDRPKYLSIWSGKRIKVDRSKHEGNVPIRVPFPCLSLFGALVPDSLASLSSPLGAADGFIDRFLFAFPEPMPVPHWNERGVDPALVQPWVDLAWRLWDRPLDGEDGRERPHVVYMNGDARDAWRRGHEAHVEAMRDPDFPGHLRGPWGKLREYAGRFALVLALMDHAADPSGTPETLPDATARHVRDAWRLVGYFASHARKVYGHLAGGRPARESAEQRTIVAWLREFPCESFSVSKLTQARKSLRNNPNLETALAELVRNRVLRCTPKQPGKKSPVYEVHPSLRGTAGPT